MLMLSALFLYILKKMRNIDISSGRGLILSGDRQRAGTFVGIARKRMFLMKQMMKVGNLQYMKRTYYLDRDCVWVRLLSIDGSDFIRIHSCAEGGCNAAFLHIDTIPRGQGGYTVQFDASFKNERGIAKRPELPDITPPFWPVLYALTAYENGPVVGGMTRDRRLPPGDLISNIYPELGDYDTTFHTFIAEGPSIGVVGIRTPGYSIFSIPTGGLNNYAGTLSFAVRFFDASTISITINGVPDVDVPGVTRYNAPVGLAYLTNFSQAGLVFTSIPENDPLVIELTYPIHGDPGDFTTTASVRLWPYSCIAKSVKTITLE